MLTDHSSPLWLCDIMPHFPPSPADQSFSVSYVGFPSTSPVNITPQDSVPNFLLFSSWVNASIPRHHLHTDHIQISCPLNPNYLLSIFPCMPDNTKSICQKKKEKNFFSSMVPNSMVPSSWLVAEVRYLDVTLDSFLLQSPSPINSNFWTALESVSFSTSTISMGMRCLNHHSSLLTSFSVPVLLPLFHSLHGSQSRLLKNKSQWVFPLFQTLNGQPNVLWIKSKALEGANKVHARPGTTYSSLQSRHFVH